MRSRVSHPRFEHHKILREEYELWRSSVCDFRHPPVTSLSLRAKYCQRPARQHPSIYVLPLAACKIVVCVILYIV
jgi:hypothetical protein